MSGNKTGSRHRNWVFTYNNPPYDWCPAEVFSSCESIQFLAGQFEYGNEGTLHYQGYAVLSYAVGFSGLRKRLKCPTGHFEPRRGTHQEALSYCLKDLTRAEGLPSHCFGEEPSGNQGKRNDLLAVKELIDEGGTLKDVADFSFGSYIRYGRAFQGYQDLVTPHRTEAPAAYYVWGPAGTGKSQQAWAHASSSAGSADRVYSVPLSSGDKVWFDGYVPGYHRAVIFDDYYHNFKFSFLLQLLDRYAIQVPLKGGFTKFTAPLVYFTSNIPLDSQYPNIPDSIALWRRFKCVLRYYDDRVVRCTPLNPNGLF